MRTLRNPRFLVLTMAMPAALYLLFVGAASLRGRLGHPFGAH